MTWFSVLERLPPPNERVLAFRPHEKVVIAYHGRAPAGFGYDEEQIAWWYRGSEIHPTKWMPVPT